MPTALPAPRPGESPDTWVRRAGEVFAVFDRQDSGCVSYGVSVSGDRLFVKTAGTRDAAGSLRSAVRFHRAVRHPTINPVLEAVGFGGVPALVMPWFDGDLLHHATVDGAPDRGHPAGAWSRLRPSRWWSGPLTTCWTHIGRSSTRASSRWTSTTAR
jgi:serine/threonine-protein kinase